MGVLVLTNTEGVDSTGKTALMEEKLEFVKEISIYISSSIEVNSFHNCPNLLIVPICKPQKGLRGSLGLIELK